MNTCCKRTTLGHVAEALRIVDVPPKVRGRRYATKREAQMALREIANLVALVGLNRPVRDPDIDAVLDSIEQVAGSWANLRRHDPRRATCRGGAS